jgi:hypothetical protein
LLARIAKIEDRLPAPLPTADGVRDGDYRLTPDGLGDSHIPGTGRPDYGLKCCFIPAAGQKYEVPPLFFAAKGEDLKGEASTFEVKPGFLTVLSNGTPPPATHVPNRRSGRFGKGERPDRNGRPARARAFTIPKSSEPKSRKADAGQSTCPR